MDEVSTKIYVASQSKDWYCVCDAVVPILMPSIILLLGVEHNVQKSPSVYFPKWEDRYCQQRYFHAGLEERREFPGNCTH